MAGEQIWRKRVEAPKRRARGRNSGTATLRPWAPSRSWDNELDPRWRARFAIASSCCTLLALRCKRSLSKSTECNLGYRYTPT